MPFTRSPPERRSSTERPAGVEPAKRHASQRRGRGHPRREPALAPRDELQHARAPGALANGIKDHIFTLPDQPDRIPYRTSYYHKAWGLCITHRQWESLPDGDYEVHIDADLAPGHLTYGEWLLPGKSADEVLLSTHICHPSLANDNLSGIAVLSRLGRYLASVPRQYTYRLIFIPGTIGAITWLAHTKADLARIRHALVIACVGDAGGPTYKRSRHQTAIIDRAAEHVLQHAAPSRKIEDFIPYGYDERQFCSPGINLPAGLFMRSKFGTFPEYHTSADNLEFIRPAHLAESYDLLRRILFVVDHNDAFRNLQPKGEPQLGRRGFTAPSAGIRTAFEPRWPCCGF